MATRRNALGRGLGALIPAPSVASGTLDSDSGPAPEHPTRRTASAASFPRVPRRPRTAHGPATLLRL